MQTQSLEKQILDVFNRAMDDGQLDAAEHLLRALEALASDGMRTSILGDAYATIARSGSRSCPRRRGH